MVSLPGELLGVVEAGDDTPSYPGELLEAVEAGDVKLLGPGELLVAMRPSLAYRCLLVGCL